MNKEERETFLHRTRIVEELLTLHCPRCGLAFQDYDGCAALYCNHEMDGLKVGGCECGFCAICFKDCGDDAHEHLKNEHQDFPGIHGQFYVSNETIQAHWLQLRKRNVEEY